MMIKANLLGGGFLITALAIGGISLTRQSPASFQDMPEPGQLAIQNEKGDVVGFCPLKHTSVKANIEGGFAQVNVDQTFVNKSSRAIEAVYVFPLPEDAAVNQMDMVIGERIIKGSIKKRDEARMIYEEARNNGQAAALLDQERPNIFTQNVANILPGQEVKISIHYVQSVKFTKGQYEFNFPMVVGPRYLAHTPDADKVNPPMLPPAVRNGSNIDVQVTINAGCPIQGINSEQHSVSINPSAPGKAFVRLDNKNEMPNRDFILRYRVSDSSIQESFVAHKDPINGGFFALTMLPPAAPSAEQIAPRELIFVVDQSGSQSGLPIEKSRQVTMKMIHAMRAGDTFNVIGFSNDVNKLWESPRPATENNVAEATRFVGRLQADGGTELIKAVFAALADQPSKRLRLVLFNTDGFVGNEKDILAATQRNIGKARIFTFGIGSSVNRYLISGLSEEGRGSAEYVTLDSDADKAVKRFVERTQSPILTDVAVTVNGVEVSDLTPQRAPDVFADTPIAITGKYSGSGSATVVITGKLGSQPYRREIPVTFPESNDAPTVPTLWARRKIEEYSRTFATEPEQRGATEDRITSLGLKFGLMTDYTSFVAVAQKVVNVDGHPVRVDVPVEMPQGVTMGMDKDTGRYSGPMGVGRGRYSGPMGGAPATSTLSSGPRRGGAAAGQSSTGTFGVGVQPAPMSQAKAGGISMDDEARMPGTSTSKIEKSLVGAKGTLTLQLQVKAVTDDLKAKLKKLGLSIIGEDKGLKVFFVKGDAKLLQKIADLVEVQKITKLKF